VDFHIRKVEMASVYKMYWKEKVGIYIFWGEGRTEGKRTIWRPWGRWEDNLSGSE